MVARLCKAAQSIFIFACIAAVIVGFFVHDAVQWVARRFQR